LVVPEEATLVEVGERFEFGSGYEIFPLLTFGSRVLLVRRVLAGPFWSGFSRLTCSYSVSSCIASLSMDVKVERPQNGRWRGAEVLTIWTNAHDVLELLNDGDADSLMSDLCDIGCLLLFVILGIGLVKSRFVLIRVVGHHYRSSSAHSEQKIHFQSDCILVRDHRSDTSDIRCRHKGSYGLTTLNRDEDRLKTLRR
jgi:hypothetical protein